MFSELTQRPADPILGLSVKFKADTNPKKIDLGPGIYKDEQGNTPVLACVKLAEQYRVDQEATKTYINSAGSALFNEKITALNLGDHRVIRENRIRTISTPGGTGALRIAGEFIKTCKPGATIWVSNPTWANHDGVFTAAGLTVKSYPYYDYENKCLDFDGMLDALKQVPADDAVLIHACCHNPSGMDLNHAQWQQIAELAKEKGFLPVVDMAYQGFGEGLEEDARGLRLLAAGVALRRGHAGGRPRRRRRLWCGRRWWREWKPGLDVKELCARLIRVGVSVRVRGKRQGYGSDLC